MTAVLETTTTATSTQSVAKNDTRDADLYSFTMAMGAIAVMVVLMDLVGAVTGTAIITIAAGLVASAATFIGVYTGINLLNR